MTQKPIPVLPVRRAADGVWEAILEEVHGSDDVLVRENLDETRGTRAQVRVAGEVKTLLVFVETDGNAVVRYAEALPG